MWKSFWELPLGSRLFFFAIVFFFAYAFFNPPKNRSRPAVEVHDMGVSGRVRNGVFIPDPPRR